MVHFESLAKSYLKKLNDATGKIPFHLVEELSNDLATIWKTGKQFFIFGNGGSAGNAIHIANDFLYGICPDKAPRIKVHALPANSSVLTCLANDEGYENVFSEQLKTFAESGDIALALSGSGNSKNILKALHWCKQNNVKTFAFLGYSGGEAKNIADVAIHVPIDDMQISEDIQLILGHLLMQKLSASHTINK